MVIMGLSWSHTETAMDYGRSHTINGKIFEVYENGTKSEKLLVAKFHINAYKDGTTTAECSFAYILYKNDNTFYIEPHFATSESGRITNIVSQEGRFSLNVAVSPATSDRIIHVVASQKAGDGNFDVSGVGVWKSYVDETLIKVEWREIDSIDLKTKTMIQHP
jgi:hypothetical protein